MKRHDVRPTADQPGTLVDQLNAVLFFVTRTDPDQSAEDRWEYSRFACLPHVRQRSFSEGDQGETNP